MHHHILGELHWSVVDSWGLSTWRDSIATTQVQVYTSALEILGRSDLIDKLLEVKNSSDMALVWILDLWQHQILY